jgi:hypothetical protein
MPNGGPYDEQPPKFVSSKPTPGQTNYKGKTVEILFDELIQIERPTENVIITPPQKQLPVIRPSGRKVVVELIDTLQEQTTYTIDFTNSIVDNNEKNVLENFTFAFATGDILDSLEVSGHLLNAENLEPMPGITIGLHKNLHDTAFVKEPFIRTSRTNDRGRFVIRNISPGTYRIFALNDKNRDYKFDQPDEEIAFRDSLITPSFEFTTRQDTLWKDTLTIDTIKTVAYTRFLPDSIELRLFREKFERQYILRPERTQDNRFTIRFNAPLDSLPTTVPLNFSPVDSSDWYISQWAEEKKAINYWLTDSLIWKQDTLQIEITYQASDSLNNLVPRTDTLSLSVRNRPQQENKRQKKEEHEPAPINFLGVHIDAPGSMDIFDTIAIVFDEPVQELSKEMFRLNLKTDTLLVPVDFDFFPDSINALGFFINRKWNYGEEYHLEVDSATIYSIYDKWNNRANQTFSIKAEDQYGHLFINIQGMDTIPAFVELLNGNDEPVRKAGVKNGGALFMDLPPARYYARLIQDLNNNFLWDTGNYAEKQQPETVFYYPKEIEVMKNWRLEIQDPPWDIQTTPSTRQKPMEITKNKPKEVTKPKRDYRDEGRRQSSSGSSNLPGGVRF